MSQTLRKFVANELSGQRISVPPAQRLTFTELCFVYWRRWRRYTKYLFRRLSDAKAKRAALEAPLKDFLFPVHRRMDRLKGTTK